MADDARPPGEAFIAALADALAAAVTAAELELATRPPEDSGVTRTLEPDDLRIGLRLVPSALPRVRLRLDHSMDAGRLAAAWGIERPVAVSTDVHQQHWWLLAGGREVPDPHGPRMAAERPAFGRWELGLRLVRRPAGELPGITAGASPAYDLRERDGEIDWIEVAHAQPPTTAVDASHPAATELRSRLAERWPHWRPGWDVSPGVSFVLIERDGHPAAGAAIDVTPNGVATASRVCLLPEAAADGFGAVLLDILEALARASEASEIRLDGSAFLYGPALPLERYGYVTAPPYQGDADVPVWSVLDLREPGRPGWPGWPAS